MEYEPLPTTPREPRNEPRNRPRNDPRKRPALRLPRSGLLRWLLPGIVVLIAGAFTGVLVASVIHMPRVDTLVDYSPSLVTQLHDKDGQVFATFARERRVMLKEGEIPLLVQQAVLASEDANFFHHGGVDAMGILRAAWVDLRAGGRVEGASTITMQLARSLFLSRERTWRRKIEEAFLAVELEKNYSKQQIIALYLNLVNLGHGNYGVEAASRDYFDKPAAKLTLSEAATLAGILPAPSRYSPYRIPDVVLKNRNRVLRRMHEERYITRAEYEKALGQPLQVAPQQKKINERFAPYFGEDVRKYLESNYGAATLYEAGLRVETTLDPRIQRAAEQAVRQGLLRLDRRRGWRGPITVLDGEDLDSHELPSWHRGPPIPERWYQGIVLESGSDTAKVKIGDQVYPLTREGIAWTRRREPDDLLKRGAVAWFRFEEPEPAAETKGSGATEAPEKETEAPLTLFLEQPPAMEGAAVVVEHGTGAVRAMVGGWDFERNKFNRVTQARRQVGSAFKIFVYGAALEAGWTPADTLMDAPTAFVGADGKLSYRPQNYYKNHYGIVTLRRSLEQSINVPAVKLWDLVGGGRVIDFAHRAGIKSELPNYPSISLGAADLIPLELAAAVATVANQGTYIEPHFIEKVETNDGQVLMQHFPETYTATNSNTAFVLTHMLEGVVDRGTAYAIHDLPIDLAGKTGTTDDFSDAWFVGFTPRYTILTWVGHDQKKSLGGGMSGSVAALPIWRDIVEDGLATGWLEEGEKFSPPPGIAFQEVEYYSGLLPGEGSNRIIREAFVAGTEPAREYDPQWSTISNLPWYQQRAFYIPKEGEKMPGQPEDAAEPEAEDEDAMETVAPEEAPGPGPLDDGEPPPGLR
jgi:penicillin-binding protein 1A